MIATRRQGRSQLGRVAVALSGVALLLGMTVGVAGGAAADPPDQAYENHHEAQEGKAGKDNSIRDDGLPHAPEPTPEPTPEPEPVEIMPLAATVAPEPADLLACGETITADGKGIQPDVAVSRLVDADKALASECDPFPYELKSTPDGLRFIKPSGYPLAQFFVDVTWYRALGDLEKWYSVDFEAVDGGYPVEMTDCPASVRDSETGEVVGLTDAKDLSPQEFANLGIFDQDGRVYGDANDNGLTQFACVASTTTAYDAWAANGPRPGRVPEAVAARRRHLPRVGPRARR